MALMEKHNLGRRPVTIAEGIKEATHSLLQRGPAMRTRAPDHPLPIRDMTCVYGTGCRKRKRSDTKGVITTTPRAPPINSATRLYILRNQQYVNPWHQHQSVRIEERGRCCWEKCLGILMGTASGVKRGRPKQTHMNCEECSAKQGSTTFLCNDRIGKAKGKETA